MLIRTFAAVPVADPAAVAALTAAQAALGRAPGRVRWVAPHQFHFTLKFLGDLTPAQVAAARGALQRAAAGAAPFTLAIAGLGAFPRPEAARVLWAGCGEGGAALGALAARTEAEMVAAGFAPEPRPFSPHLTLGRVPAGGATPELAAALRAGAGQSFGTVAVAAAVLYRSDLQAAGPAYTPLAAFALGG